MFTRGASQCNQQIAKQAHTGHFTLNARSYQLWRLCPRFLRGAHTESSQLRGSIALQGKQRKDDYKARHQELQRQKRRAASPEDTARLAKWDLTVGLEIHAQLNSDRKLFSTSRASVDDVPNTNVTFFDLAFPGSQPVFQTSTVLPALRAAIALNCNIQNESTFDRKHYFYPDQPAGYQITQYYRPFAVDGHIDLSEFEGSESLNQPSMVGIKQIQLEQDTAKSIIQPPSTTLIDFNRVGQPLIEIITLPHIHSPQEASACARKILAILQAVNAVTTGMEMGGLRADVNVSVSSKGSSALGQRTEIKNVSSFKAIEQAVIAERDRQIEILESGGIIKSETRGWTLGESQTTRLRGKEGEVDYRYMPDPDVPPLMIDQPLIDYIRQTLPPVPDAIVTDLVKVSGLSPKDAYTLVGLDDGKRLEYYDDVCEKCSAENVPTTEKEISKMAGNWIIHELGGLLSSSSLAFSPSLVPSTVMASILMHLRQKSITGTSAKRLLSIAFHSGRTDVEQIIAEEDMTIKRLAPEEYLTIAQKIIELHPAAVQAVKKGQEGKLKFLIGQMMRAGQGTLEAKKAEEALKDLISNSRD